MSDSEPRPARLVVWLLERVSSSHAARAAVGDILEELEQLTSLGRRPRWTAWWLTRQLLAATAAEARVATPRCLRSAGHTLRDAARALRRSPAHAVFILIVLGVTISAATVTFSVVDAVVLRSLPFDQPERLVQVQGRNRRGPYPLRAEEFRPIHDGVPAFESFGAFMRGKQAVTVEGTTEPLEVIDATSELFQVLRLKPALGRVWTTDEETRGDDHVTVISFKLWRRRFSSDPAVLGRLLQVGGGSYRIIGVLPAAADGQAIGWSTDVWVPGVPSPERSSFVGALGRLRDNATPELVDAQVRNALAPLMAAKPAAYADWQPEVTPWQDAMVGKVRGWMLLILGAVGLVVLIGCVNAANVMLARSVSRARELAIRASLGASRRQIALSLLAESLLLSTAATACALLFAVWGVRAAKAALPLTIFRADSIGLNGRVLLVSILTAVATGLVFGMVPAWLASRVSIVGLLKDAGATGTTARSGWRRGLLVAQIGCISVLLVVSTLFVASFVRVMQLDLGIEQSRLLGVLPLNAFKGTVDDVERRLRQVPGVVDVAVVTGASLPVLSRAFHGAYPTTTLRPVGPGGADALADVLVYRVTANYFDVTGMRFRRGSTWSAAPPVDQEPVVIDELAARRLFGDRDPLGLQVTTTFFDDRVRAERSAVFTVTGVVPYVHAKGPEGDMQPAMYLPLVQRPSRIFAGLFARTAMPAEAVVPAVEDSLATIAPQGERSYVHAMDEAMRVLTASRRFSAGLMSLFALFALLMGAAGIYGVMASIVAQRTREIGVRIALGASVGDIRRGVLGEAGRHLALGLAGGLPIAWWISRGFGTLFFQVGPTDLSIYLTVGVLLAAVALVAAIVPARRASRVDPVVSLRAS